MNSLTNAGLGPQAPAGSRGRAPGLWTVQRYEQTGSTQDVALDAARGGEPGPLAIIADRQTAGRGREGRAWQAPEGNLNFSALLRPKSEVLVAGAWSLLAGVAVHEAVAASGGAGLMLKWPNDLLLDGAKLGGMLIDSSLMADGLVEWVVIGVGVNLAAAPEVAGRRVACLASAGVVTTPEDLACRLMEQIDHWRAAGFGAVRQAWLARAHPVGTLLRVRRGGDVIEGTFLGLAEDGRLRLDGAGDTASGEVDFLPPPAAGDLAGGPE